MKFNKLPLKMQNEATFYYLSILNKKKAYFVFKRLFDIFLSLVLIILLIPLFIIISFIIKIDSKGPIIYKQERVTKYLNIFNIYKFRTMVNNADKIGSQITISNDNRITKIGKFLRKFRLDELPQLFNILIGHMSFVGPRPEVLKYVDMYSNQMYATLLIKAGVTSIASIKYKDEYILLSNTNDVDRAYINEILPKKMDYNYLYLKKCNFFYDIYLILKTIICVVF